MKLAVEIYGGKLIGAEVGSTKVSYLPSRRANVTENNNETTSKRARTENSEAKYVADTGTAGSVALLLQTSFLPALAESINLGKTVQLELRGGTNAENAPQIDYVSNVLLPFINGYYKYKKSDNNTLQIEILKRGYYPNGGGVITASVSLPINAASSSSSAENQSFPPIQLTKCKSIASLRILAFHAGHCPSWISQKMVDGAMKVLKRACKENESFCKRFCREEDDTDPLSNAVSIIENAERVITHEKNCLGSGSGIIIIALPSSKNDSPNEGKMHLPLAASALGNRKVPPLQSGMNAASELVECISSGGCVDRWLQDQLIPFMALAGSNSDNDKRKSEILVGELTLHTQTAIAVAEWVTGCKFEIERMTGDDPFDTISQDHKCKMNDHGEVGLVTGKHIIRCQGIGYQYSQATKSQEKI
jgi:RNA 3'-terminal phosphate cyclase (ATP)